jgi:hypothetical protein
MLRLHVVAFTIGPSKIPEFLSNAAVSAVADKRLSQLQRRREPCPRRLTAMPFATAAI